MKTKHGVSVYRCCPYNRERESECESMPRTIYNDEKNKMVIVDDDDYVTGLHVQICQAMGLENPVCHLSESSPYYNVVYWVEPDVERRTGMASGLTPQWNHRDTFLLENPDDCAYLHVEVQRYNLRVDPETSLGKAVVGRARIPFPKEFNSVKKGYFPLVRAEGECKLGGDIYVQMKLEKILI